MPETLMAEHQDFSAIKENLKFLLLEVAKQIRDSRAVLMKGRSDLIDKIAARDDYIDNLKSVLENKTFRLLSVEKISKPACDLLRAVNIITSNLEHIADYAVNMVGQSRYVEDLARIVRFEPEPFFDEILDALDRIYDALFDRDLTTGLRICRSEVEVDRLYDNVFRKIMARLRAGEAPEELVTILFMYRYLERMADDLLNIGEAIIFAAVGEKIKVSQFQALEETLADSGMDISVPEADTRGIWETRSGCRIYTVREEGSDKNARWVVFKEGRLNKLRGERAALEFWERIKPGLPPKILGFQERGDKGSMLLEYLGGNTFQRIALDGSDADLAATFPLLAQTLDDIWSRTWRDEPVNAGFLRQLKARIKDVFNIHPDFKFPISRIGKMEWKSYEELISLAESVDEKLSAPFSVLIHGDFNVDNIIVDPPQGRVHFIDMHRSTNSDYVQDVSVFIVSNFRMPVFDSAVRERLDCLNLEFYRFATDFARKHGDATFHARLAMGLIRSFTTSTRFELNKDFAKSLFMRAVFLLNLVIDHPGPDYSDFSLPEEVLVY